LNVHRGADARLEGIREWPLTLVDSVPPDGIDPCCRLGSVPEDCGMNPATDGSCRRSSTGKAPERLDPREAHLPTEHPEAGEDPWVPQAHVDPVGAGDLEVEAAQGAPQAHRLRDVVAAGRVGRLTTKDTFAALQRSRRRGASGPVHAVFAPAPEEAVGAFPQVRVGYAVGKRCGSAVERNTLRRRMREVARATGPSLPRGSYLLRLSPEARSLERARFRADVATALRRAGGVPAPPTAGPTGPFPQTAGPREST
jgi:ribonuclease P protein component